MKKLVVSILVVIPSLVLPQNDRGLLDTRLRDLLHEALSGELAKEHVIGITRHHRIQGSRGYRAAANYVLDQLREYGYGIGDAYIESFLSDGKVSYQTWQSPSGWDITSAELRMMEPYEERIVGYPEVAMSVITYSNAGEGSGELVWVGEGTKDKDYEGKNVKGKFVLATGYGGEVHRHAVLKYGAKAVVCYLDDERAQEYPDMLQYTGMWPKSEELPRVTYGFNLTNRQGEKLRKLLQSGQKVVLYGSVSGTGLESFYMDVVSARIRGSEIPEEEIVFSAHLDHPKESANDNASGSAAILDIARALREQIESGRLQRPRRTLRFLWVPEWYGTMAYIDAHPEVTGPMLGGRFLANLNLDMVGENTELLHSKLIVTRSPKSVRSILDDVVADMISMVDQMNITTPRGSKSIFNYRHIPYAGGSDHMMFIDRKIPATMFSHDPDYTHHTSEDTPDKVDPVELERCEMIAAGTAMFLANMNSTSAADLLFETFGNGMARIGAVQQRAQRRVADANRDEMSFAWINAQNELDHHVQWEIDVLQSVLHFNSSETVKSLVQSIRAQIEIQHAGYTRLLRETAIARGMSPTAAPGGNGSPDSRIPVRITRGPIAFDLPEKELPAQAAGWYEAGGKSLTGNVRFEIVNFINGIRTVSDIRNAVSAEYGPMDLKVVARYVEDLVKADVVQWKQQRP